MHRNILPYLFVACSSALAMIAMPASAQTVMRDAELSGPVHFDVSPPLRDLAVAAEGPRAPVLRRVLPIPRPAAPLLADPALQAFAGSQQMPAPLTNFDGVGQGFTGPAGTFTVNSAPPDPNMAAGPNHLVQIVNSDFAVFNKTGVALLGPVPTNTVWSGFGGLCQTDNDGDGIVQYDAMADRWLVTQFAVSGTNSHFLECVAVSTTADPTGTYFRYSFDYGSKFPDYPKVAVWPDAYYVTYNMFNSQGTAFFGAKACAFDRTSMLQGLTATQQCFSTSNTIGGLLPADLDGALPPTGSPNYMVALGANANELAFFKFHVDWVTPANSTFTGPTVLATAAYTEACAGGTCIPQAGTTQKLDSLSDRLMYRLAYRNFGDHEALVTNHSVTAGSSVGVRWYEIRSPGTSPAIFQQGTYAPDANFRWMGSIALDQVGNMALGFSLSGTTIKPQIHYTGRLVGDAAGTMGQGEASIIDGAGVQTGFGLSRWGDYTAMRVDPADNCTFWYTNQYQAANGAFNWHTRIGSFTFPSCVVPATSTALSPSTNPSVFGQSVTFTATVTGATPGGTITFNDGAAVLCAAVAMSGGQAQCVSAALSVGGHSLTATYSGDVNNAGSTSPTLSQVVNKADTSTTIGAHTPDPSTVGSPIAVSASVTASAPGAGTPGGTITVSDGTATCLITLPATVCNLIPLSAGAKTLTATYGGDGNFNGSTSSGVAHTVNAVGTTTALSPSSNPSVFGQSITLTGTVTGATPTGTITFNDGAAVLCAAVAMSGGQAQCISAALSVGGHSLTATYSGDVNNAGSTSPTLSQVVNKADTTTAIGTHTPNPSTVGSPIAVSASVTVSAPGAGVPGGTITVSDGMATCLITLPATGCNLTPVSAGAKTLTATYGGDGNFNGGTSPGVAHTVNAVGTTTALSPSSNPSVFGQSITLTGTVTGATPTGTITFNDGAAVLCAAVAMSGGQAQCISAALSVGGHSLTATYSGDVNNAGSTSPTLSQVVNKADTTTAIGTHTPNPSTVGSPIAVSASVTVSAPGAGVPGGTITVSDGTATCLITLPATGCNLTPISAGAKTLTASYGGDGNFNGSTSPGVAHTVDGNPPALLSAVSRRVHGVAGTFDLPLTLTTPPTINHDPTTEPRVGPAQQLVFSYDRPLNAATVTVTEGTATASSSVVGSTVVVDLTGVNDAQYVTVSLSNVGSTDGGTGGVGEARVGFLTGDVNQSRIVAVTDLVVVNNQLAKPLTVSNFLSDVNTSGIISNLDKVFVNNNLAHFLPAP